MGTTQSIPRIPALDLSALSWWVGGDLVTGLVLLDSSPLCSPFAGMIAGAPAWWTQALASIQAESLLHQLCRLGNPQRFLGGIISGQWSQLTGVELGPEVRLAKCIPSGGESGWGTTHDLAKEVTRTYAWKVLTTPPPYRFSYIRFMLQLILLLVSASIFAWRWRVLKTTEAATGADIQALSVLVIVVTNAIGSVVTWYRWQNFKIFLDKNAQLAVDTTLPNQTGIWSGYTEVVKTAPVIVVGIQEHRDLSRPDTFSDPVSAYWCMAGLLINTIFGLAFGIGGVLSEDGSLALIYIVHGVLQATIIVVAWRRLDGAIVNTPIDRRAKVAPSHDAKVLHREHEHIQQAVCSMRLTVYNANGHWQGPTRPFSSKSKASTTGSTLADQSRKVPLPLATTPTNAQDSHNDKERAGGSKGFKEAGDEGINKEVDQK
ncbi:hypothetical protein M408DRAFT_205381 [Serendipita vermifera MAFF 305830]|uniref:Uncharacterized protein n=1 Tax=Serendipita vermifera MAFF 305830 TaxID=933852 RepID=A0A0C3B0A4_SERVB|nr:hypothetical protein M408DRAFT_205381 [Serendipita vermifera MAFF 305830]